MRLHCANGLVVQGAAQFRTLEGTLAGTKIHISLKQKTSTVEKKFHYHVLFSHRRYTLI